MDPNRDTRNDPDEDSDDVRMNNGDDDGGFERAFDEIDDEAFAMMDDMAAGMIAAH